MMKKILNPFEYLSIGKAWLWGLLGIFFAIGLMLSIRWPLEWTAADIITILSMNVMLWLPLSTLLYVAALIFSPSRIRAVDIFATNLFSLLPVIVFVGISSVITFWLQGLNTEPLSVVEITGRVIYNLIIILLSVIMVWSMVWGCFAYSVSANMKGWRGIVIFVICYIFVSVVIQTVLQYL